jgi:hypothetical protein
MGLLRESEGEIKSFMSSYVSLIHNYIYSVFYSII